MHKQIRQFAAIVGSVLLSQKKYDEAQPVLEMAVKRYPTCFTLRALAILCCKTGDKARYLELVNEMEAMGKAPTISNRDMGMIYAVIGEYDVAAGNFEKRHREPEGNDAIHKIRHHDDR